MRRPVYTLKLSDFLRTGSIGELKIGTARGRVFELLGEPSDWLNGEKKEVSLIWKYGEVEIGFLSDKLDAAIWYIQMEDFPDKDTPVNFTDFSPGILASRQSLENYLSQEKLTFWQDKNYPVSDDDICYVIDCKTKIVYSGADSFVIATHECR